MCGFCVYEISIFNLQVNVVSMGVWRGEGRVCVASVSNVKFNFVLTFKILIYIPAQFFQKKSEIVQT